MECLSNIYLFLAINTVTFRVVPSHHTCEYHQVVSDGAYLDGFIFTYYRGLDIYQCAAKCIMHTICASFNFEISTRSCYLSNTTSEDPNVTLLDNTGFLHSDIVNWPKSLASSCFNHTCHKTQRCEVRRDRSPECVRTHFKSTDNELTSSYIVMAFTRSWSISKILCEGQGAEFVMIDSDKEQNFIKNILYALGREKFYHWLGGQFDITLGGWRWWDQSIVNNTYWAPGEPGSGIQDICISAMFRTGWYSEDCYTNNTFICET